jgi:hypothetical protein
MSKTKDTIKIHDKKEMEQLERALLKFIVAAQWCDYSGEAIKEAVMISSIIHDNGDLSMLPPDCSNLVKDILYNACQETQTTIWDDPVLAMAAWPVLLGANSMSTTDFTFHAIRSAFRRMCPREDWKRFLDSHGLSDTERDTGEDWSEARTLHKGALLNDADINGRILDLCAALNITLLHPAIIGNVLTVLQDERKKGDVKRFYKNLLSEIESGSEQ